MWVDLCVEIWPLSGRLRLIGSTSLQDGDAPRLSLRETHLEARYRAGTPLWWISFPQFWLVFFILHTRQPVNA